MTHHRFRRLKAGLVATLLAAAVASLTSGHAAAQPYPVITDPLQGQATGMTQAASVSPAGSNHFDCRDTEGRDPVILLHGTSNNQQAAWGYLAPTLANAGYCVFSLTYGQASWSFNMGASGSQKDSAHELATFVDRVLTATGAKKVDLIGHSQGGPVAQWFAALPGRAKQVDTFVGLGSPNRGFEIFRIIGEHYPASADLTAPNPAVNLGDFLPKKNDTGPTQPNITYVNIATTHDEITFPYQGALMMPGPNIKNVVVQDTCPHSIVGHLGLTYSRTVGDLVFNALDPDEPRKVRCGQDFPL